MPDAQVGQRVQVDISGLQAPGVSVGGASVTGTIIALNALTGQITVRMDVVFSGQDVVTVPADRVAVIKGEG